MSNNAAIVITIAISLLFALLCKAIDAWKMVRLGKIGTEAASGQS